MFDNEVIWQVKDMVSDYKVSQAPSTLIAYTGQTILPDDHTPRQPQAKEHVKQDTGKGRNANRDGQTSGSGGEIKRTRASKIASGTLMSYTT